MSYECFKKCQATTKHTSDAYEGADITKCSGQVLGYKWFASHKMNLYYFLIPEGRLTKMIQDNYSG